MCQRCFIKYFLQTWPPVKVRIGTTGRKSLKRRVSEFRVEDLHTEVAKNADAILQERESREISEASAGAATFYAWVSILKVVRYLSFDFYGWGWEL